MGTGGTIWYSLLRETTFSECRLSVLSTCSYKVESISISYIRPWYSKSVGYSERTQLNWLSFQFVRFSTAITHLLKSVSNVSIDPKVPERPNSLLQSADLLSFPDGLRRLSWKKNAITMTDCQQLHHRTSTYRQSSYKHTLLVCGIQTHRGIMRYDMIYREIFSVWSKSSFSQFSLPQLYTVSHKSRPPSLSHIFATHWPIFNFYCHTVRKTCNATIIKDPTTPRKRR